jgi:cytochrome c556
MTTMFNGLTAAAIALGVGAAVAAGGALAHDDKMPANAGPATKAAYVRHENFERLGAAFKSLNDELRKGSPDKAVVAKSAATMNQLVTALPTWFPRGSGVEARAMSEAKANIWTDSAGFTAAATTARGEVGKLNAAAAAGNIDAVKASVRPVGGSCKGCHDKYRQQKS